MKLQHTIRGLMILVAIVGLLLGVAINLRPFLPVVVVAVIILSPQIIVVAISSFVSARHERQRAERDHPH
jgi:hypothetical protein